MIKDSCENIFNDFLKSGGSFVFNKSVGPNNTFFECIYNDYYVRSNKEDFNKTLKLAKTLGFIKN